MIYFGAFKYRSAVLNRSSGCLEAMSLRGGNMVDGLPQAFNSGITKDFCIFVSLVFWRGKFDLTRIIFPSFFGGILIISA